MLLLFFVFFLFFFLSAQNRSILKRMYEKTNTFLRYNFVLSDSINLGLGFNPMRSETFLSLYL